MKNIFSSFEIGLSCFFGLIVSLAHMYKGSFNFNNSLIAFLLGTYIAFTYFSYQKEFKNRYVFFISLSVIFAFLISLLSVRGFEFITFVVAIFVGAICASLKKASSKKNEGLHNSILKKGSLKKKLKRPFKRKNR